MFILHVIEKVKLALGLIYHVQTFGERVQVFQGQKQKRSDFHAGFA